MITPLTITEAPLPETMPSPFSHEPAQVAQVAARQLQHELLAQGFHDGSTGQMYGVLVVRDAQGRLGFCSAFAGMRETQWQSPGFAGPLFDLESHKALWCSIESELEILHRDIMRIETDPSYRRLQAELDECRKQQSDDKNQLGQEHLARRRIRHERRNALRAQGQLAGDVLEALAQESCEDKRRRRQLSQRQEQELVHRQNTLSSYVKRLEKLERRRTELSRQMLPQFQALYRIKNRLGQSAALEELFDRGVPAGAGDCAGPKLLHLAHTLELEPIAMAEFWWGRAPKTGGRYHGHFYPACRGKCGPVMGFMLQGLDVEEPPLWGQGSEELELSIIFEDADIVVFNKPAGLLSVPGRHNKLRDSVQSRLQAHWGENSRLAHRLDLDVSGLIIGTKNRESLIFLQRQFSQRKVRKQYVALVQGHLQEQSGQIDLPLTADINDRPRQIVDDKGKPSLTEWRQLESQPDFTRVELRPVTGRTHQLRVHTSHPRGLNAPIVGDRLYGQGDAKGRLMLHSMSIAFERPSGGQLELEVPAPF